jgi:hypothetical protein
MAETQPTEIPLILKFSSYFQKRLFLTHLYITNNHLHTSLCIWKGIPIQRFSELLFHLFLRITTINVVILTDVIDLSHQVIEFGEDRDDGYCEMLIWTWKMGRQKPFLALIVSENAVSSGNRALFRTKQNLSTQN